MKRASILVLLIFLLSVSGCHKKLYEADPVATTLPAATQEGKNTLGFLLNGQVWLPDSKNPLYPGIQPDVTNIHTVKGNQTLILNFSNNAVPGTYDMTKDGRSALFTKSGDRYDCYQGSLTVTKLDFDSGIFSGTFTLKLRNSTGDELSIDSGRFDVLIKK
jgi:hypothetical protein